MKVVFLEEVEGTARTGDVKNVADGFARNFLLPRRLAAPATPHYITIAEAKATKEAKKQERLDEEARDRLLPKVDGQSYSTEVRVGEQGKLFGSVTARDIAEMVQEGTGIELEHKQIDLKEPIRELGNYDITVKLTRNVLATVALSVEPLGGLPEEAEGEAGEAEEEAPEEGAAATAETEEAVEPEASAEAEEAEAEATVDADVTAEAEPAAEPETEQDEESGADSGEEAAETEAADEDEPEEEKSETE